MTSRILHVLPAFATLALFSCYPYPEPPPHRQDHRHDRDASISDSEQQKIKDQRDRMKEARDREERQSQTDPSSDGTSSAPPKPPEKRNVPVAQPVPGKEGYVFSPFNNKVIDVRDMPSGTLVADPTYPASEKKHFRVP